MALDYVSKEEVIKILEAGKPVPSKEKGYVGIRSLHLEYSQLIDNMIEDVKALNHFRVSLERHDEGKDE